MQLQADKVADWTDLGNLRKSERTSACICFDDKKMSDWKFANSLIGHNLS